MSDLTEDARRKAAEAQAKKDRDRELARRKAREELARSQGSVIDHGQFRK